MLQRITSLQNEKLKSFSRLYRRKYREKTNRYVAEGINLIEEALKNGAELDSVFIREDFAEEAEGRALTERLTEQGCDLFLLSRVLFDRTVNTETPAGNRGGGETADCHVGRFFEEIRQTSLFSTVCRIPEIWERSSGRRMLPGFAGFSS